MAKFVAKKNLHLGKVHGEIKAGQELDHLPEAVVKKLHSDGHAEDVQAAASAKKEAEKSAEKPAAKSADSAKKGS